jgi:hypothetical protein
MKVSQLYYSSSKTISQGILRGEGVQKVLTKENQPLI